MQKLITFLKRSEITQMEFAERIGISAQQFSDIIKKRKKMNPKLAFQIEKETKGQIKKEYLIFHEYYQKDSEVEFQKRFPIASKEDLNSLIFNEIYRMGKQIEKISEKLHENYDVIHKQYNSLVNKCIKTGLIDSENNLILNEVEEK